MTRLAFFVGLVCVASAAGCGDADVDTNLAPLAINPGSPEVPLCRWIAPRLHTQQATVYPLKEKPELVAVDLDGDIACIDATEVVLRIGIVAVPPVTRPYCSVCDGTPLPAEEWNEWTRRIQIETGFVWQP
jgi:hypothetical protein